MKNRAYFMGACLALVCITYLLHELFLMAQRDYSFVAYSILLGLPLVGVLIMIVFLMLCGEVTREGGDDE